MKLSTINHCVELLRKENTKLAEKEMQLEKDAKSIEPKAGDSKAQNERYSEAAAKTLEVQCRKFKIEDMIDDLEGRDWQ